MKHTNKLSLSKLAQEFVQASLTERTRSLKEEEERRQRELETAQKLAEESEARRKAEENARYQAEQRIVQQATANKRLRKQAIALTLSLIMAIGAGILAWFNQQQAQTESQKAKQERNNALRTQSLFLADLSNQQTEQGKTDNGILLALEALPNENLAPNQRPYVAQAEEKLYKAVFKKHKEKLVIQHKQDINHAAFSPDNQKILTASDDNTACLWDAQNGKQLSCLEHEGKVNYAAFSPDGTKVITASEDETARLWDIKSNTAQVLKHKRSVDHANFLSDGEELITVTSKNINLWNAKTGEKLSSLFTQNYLEPLQSADNNKPSVLKKHRELINTFKLSDRFLAIFKFAVVSPVGKKALISYYEHKLELWDIQSKELLSVLQHKNVNYAAFSPDGTKIVTTSNDGTAYLWDGQIGKKLYFLQHERRVNHAIFSHDSTKVITTSDDDTTCLWDTHSGKKKLCLPHDDVNYAIFSHDGNKVITSSFSSPFIINRHMQIKYLKTLDGGEVIFWNARSGRQLFVLTENLTNEIKYSAISYDDKKILTVSGDTVQFWDISRLLLGHEDRVSYASFNPEGDKIVTTSLDNTARIWNAQDGQLLAILRGHTDRVNYTIFSPDGKKIVTVSDDKTARLWDVHGKQLCIFKGHQAEVNYASFSPDSQKVVTASMDQTARLWNAQDCQYLFTLEHQSAVYHAAFNPQANQRVITASLDKTARFWNSQSGELLAIMPHKDIVYHAAFNPNGGQVATVSTDEIVQLWRIFPNTQTLIDHAHQIVPHPLTQEQRQQFFLE